MNTKLEQKQLLLKIRLVTLFFIAALVISGLTAFPLETELRTAVQIFNADTQNPAGQNNFQHWLTHVQEGVSATNANFPFLAYGTDWLAFAHIVIALAFIGVYRNPVRNKWLVSWAMICCVAIIPLALICGPIRHIPFFWRLVDCSFGVFGIIPLLLLNRMIKKLETGR